LEAALATASAAESVVVLERVLDKHHHRQPATHSFHIAGLQSCTFWCLGTIDTLSADEMQLCWCIDRKRQTPNTQHSEEASEMALANKQYNQHCASTTTTTTTTTTIVCCLPLE
jgi:hypothetical protein